MKKVFTLPVKKVFTLLGLVLAFAAVASAQNTVNFAAVGQKSTVTFVVNDTHGNAIPQSLLTLTATVADPTIASVSINNALGNLTQVTALKAGSTTVTYQFALVPGTPYTGTFNATAPDTLNVAQTPVDPNVTDSYSAPQ